MINECPRCRALWMWFASFLCGQRPWIGNVATCHTCGYRMASSAFREGWQGPLLFHVAAVGSDAVTTVQRAVTW